MNFGCIHTVQGYDLNYCGVIIGKDIDYDKEKNQIVILKENYMDANGKNGTTPEELKEYIIHIYTTLLNRGIKGTFIYACNKNLQEYLNQFIPFT